MSHRTESSTPLEAVQVDGGQVWLRRDVQRVTKAEPATGDGKAREYEAYTAEEVTFIDPTVTADYAKAHFGELWDAAEALALTPREYAERLSEQNGDAIADLSGAVSDNADALAELSELVSNLTTKEA